MKKIIYKAILPTLVCALSISGGVSAFANDLAAGEPKLISTMEETAEISFSKYEGKVSSILKRDGSVSIAISDDYGEILILDTKDAQNVYDAVNNTHISLFDVKEGDNLTIILGGNTPMTLSLPPHVNTADYIIKTNDAMSVKIDVFGNDFLSSDNELKLNISPETYITNTKGAKKIFTADDIIGKQCAVIYSFTTRSIPAQTTPIAVIILDDGGYVSERTYYIPLRETFEEMGFEVKWSGNDKPIKLIKADTTLEVTIGSSILNVNGVEAELNSETILDGDVAVVDSSILNYI